ncbi:MAG: hypothetical protein RLZZ200_1264 [Pseudomonadota bacterium]|jgi:hypothetical protein
MNRQRGQAVVEFAVSAAVFALMLLGTVWIFRLHDIQRQAILSARAAAFTESWMHGRESADAAQLRLRQVHFEQAGWLDPTGNEPMPGSEQAVVLRLSQRSPPGTAPAAVDVAMAPLRAVGSFLGDGFELPMNRQATALVEVGIDPVKRLPEPLSSLGLRLTERYSVLGDTWAAGGPAEVVRRSAALVPASILRAPGQWLAPLLLPLSLFEPAVKRLCLGLIEPDRVPRDRLSPATGGPAQPGDRGCH